MTQFAQGLLLYLPDTLPGYVKLFADLFKGAAPPVFKPKPELQHAVFPGG